MKIPIVYIMASKIYGTLYVGVTSNLYQRTIYHKIKYYKNSFTAQHNVNRLVYYETAGSMYSAIEREKQIKKWKRAWKIRLIEEENPLWKDLFYEIF